MIEVDDALRGHAAQWRRDEPAPPDLDAALATARMRRSGRPVLLAVSAAACVLVVALAAILLDVRTGSHPAAGRHLTFKSRPLGYGDPSAAELARLRSVARSTADKYDDKNAVTADAVATTGGSSWLMEIHGDFACVGCTGPLPPGHVLTLRVKGMGVSVLNLGDDPRDLTPYGTVVDLGTIEPAPYPDAIRQQAMETAKGNGDDHATAQAVRTTFVNAERASDSGTDNVPDHAVWLVQLTGTFVCNSCSHPAGAKAPSGQYITVIVNAVPPYDSSVFGIGNRKVDLAKLGTVVTLLP